MVHQSFRVTNVGQPGGQQAVVSVDDGQTLVLQLHPQRSEAFFRLYSSFPSLLYLPRQTGCGNLLTCSFFSFSWM